MPHSNYGHLSDLLC